MFEKKSQINYLVNWLIKVIIANISKTITGVTIILTRDDTIA